MKSPNKHCGDLCEDWKGGRCEEYRILLRENAYCPYCGETVLR